LACGLENRAGQRWYTNWRAASQRKSIWNQNDWGDAGTTSIVTSTRDRSESEGSFFSFVFLVLS
jgi:hypothetical protein